MKPSLTAAAGAVLGLLALVSFGIDWSLVSAGGSIDLRNRITGARVLLNHQDAYHYKWNKQEPEELCDPYNNPALPINKVTVTPTLLMLNFPLAILPYRPAQFIWLIAQWGLLLGTGFLWLRPIPSVRWRWLWAVALIGFTFTVAWRHHTDRGQAYVAILFLLACWTRITAHPEYGNRFWGGLLAGMLVAVRPPLLLVVAPMMLLRRRGQLAGALVGLVMGVGLPMLWRPTCWTDYQSGMQTWSELYRTAKTNPRPPPQVFPAEVEDIPVDVLGHFSRSIPFADTSIFAMLRWWGISSAPALPVALALVALIALWFWFSRDHPDDALLGGIVAWSVLVDLFLPAYRNSYTDVMILNVLALVLIMRNRNWLLVSLLLAAWPVGWAVCAMLPRQRWIINLPTLIMIAATVLVVLWPCLARKNPDSPVLT
jgi:hypothetical protein